MNNELRKSKQELEEVKSSLKSANEKNIDKLIKENQSDMEKLATKKEEIQKATETLIKKYDLCNEINSLTEKASSLRKSAEEAENDYNVFSRKKDKMKKDAEKIENEIRKKLESSTNLSSYSDLAFDGMLANEMLESAANWSKRKNEEKFEKAVGKKEKFEKVMEVKSFKNNEIIDYIYDKVRQRRGYSKNEVINIMICITQGFLTVFAGEPGVGKTSICNIIAETLGLVNVDDDYNRYAEISVEKGWTSKRDLVGYYNPLTKSFDKNNKSLFKTFNVLHKESVSKIKDFPYLILLDEANLSSMEYYWADFMNVCDFDKENRKINLGEDYIYDIPNTLRFLATINYDHTTETLSPRLLDRAWIILLEYEDLNTITNVNKVKNNDSIIMYKDIEKCFSGVIINEKENISEEIITELEDIYKIFRENNLFISSRIDLIIKKYLNVGCMLFEETKSTAKEFVALDYVVAQKLLPKINGFGENYKKFLQQIEQKFNKNNMMKCRNIMGNIIKKGDNNMQYYQFFN